MSAYDRYQKIKAYLMANQDPSDLKQLQEQEELAQDARNVAGIGSGVDKIISAIGGTQANPDAYTQMQKFAGEGPARVKEYLKNKYQQNQENSRVAAILASSEDTASNKAFDNALASKKLQLEQEKFDREKEKGTPAQQEIEKDDAKTAAEWNSSGRDSFNAGMNRLEGIKTKLSSMQDSTLDKIRARLGENAYSQEQINILNDVINAALPTLKATFPGSTSNQELMTHAKSFVDFRLSPAENVRNIESKMEEARQKAATKEAIAGKFSQSGSKQGAKPTQKMIKIRNDETGEEKMVTEEEAKAMGAM